mmetsp:Transcript_51563/g.92743  ORF Transcript_51563/g.92743 Transcript_51563/m.92743 type:complete len:200 (-) Transcript_51563:3-602(-)
MSVLRLPLHRPATPSSRTVCRMQSTGPLYNLSTPGLLSCACNRHFTSSTGVSTQVEAKPLPPPARMSFQNGTGLESVAASSSTYKAFLMYPYDTNKLAHSAIDPRSGAPRPWYNDRKPDEATVFRKQSMGPLNCPEVCSSTLMVSAGYSTTLHTSPDDIPANKSRMPSLLAVPENHLRSPLLIRGETMAQGVGSPRPYY